MDGIDVFINRLPVKTYNKLGVNESKLENIRIEGEAELLVSGCSEKNEKSAAEEAEILTGAGAELTDLLKDSGVSEKVIEINEDTLKAVRLSASFEKKTLAAAVLVKVSENVKADIVVELSEKEPGANGIFSLKLNLLKGARVRLIELSDGTGDFRLVNDLGAELSDASSLELIQISNGGKIYQSFYTSLSGEGSELQADIAYKLQGNELLDMNDVVIHNGKNTKSTINAGGSLAGYAEKIFRGTIDLRKGCTGAAGNEKEEVLLLDDTVVNKTIPLILCSEEDVVGNHGATIGRPDEDKLFYLKSRGVSEKEALDMLVRASMNRTYKKVWDKELRERLLGE